MTLNSFRLRPTAVRTGAWTVLILACVASALLARALRPVDDVLSTMRFGMAQRPASQNLVVVEIDARSLAAAGAWPWDRANYAQAIDQLMAADAQIVGFDVDFSAESNALSDATLAAAIARHPGQIILASFVQGESFAVGGRRTENTPVEGFAGDALLASVNVPVDPDGEVRGYDYTAQSSQFPSIAAVLAGAPRQRGGFEVDYGIDHRSIPRLSFEEVRTGRFDRAAVQGRVVLIGATALELGDEFATPIGLVPGVFIHALAYESIVGGRALLTLNPAVLLILCGALGLLLLPSRTGGRSLHRLVLRHAAVAIAILVGPVILQTFAPVSLHIAPLILTQALFGLWGVRVELARRANAIVAEREAGLLHLALHQPDTGLPNRRALLQSIESAREVDPEAGLSVIAIGVDRHAEMRGVVGYDVADALIVKLAQRVAKLTGAALVAQISTSVLAFSMTRLSADQVAEVARDLEGLQTNFQIDGQSIDIFLRIGAVRVSGSSAAPEALVERATAALTEAHASRDRSVVYDQTALETPANNLALMSEMHRATGSGQISLNYQPKLTLGSDTIDSVEALCRWRHPTRGFIPPDLFIPLAEETGQIRSLTEWTVDRAIRDQARLREWGHDIMVAVNISGRLLTDVSFRASVLKMVSAAPSRLCFEITETAVIGQPDIAVEAIADFRTAGIKISIDDYGSGLSSLSYLKMLQADELKIDKSLVVDVLDSQRDRLIMKSTTDLAHGLGMSVVAEGVETRELAACLALLGCNVIQGYWVAKPLPILELAGFLDEHARARRPVRDHSARQASAA